MVTIARRNRVVLSFVALSAVALSLVVVSKYASLGALRTTTEKRRMEQAYVLGKKIAVLDVLRSPDDKTPLDVVPASALKTLTDAQVAFHQLSLTGELTVLLRNSRKQNMMLRSSVQDLLRSRFQRQPRVTAAFVAGYDLALLYGMSLQAEVQSGQDVGWFRDLCGLQLPELNKALDWLGVSAKLPGKEDALEQTKTSLFALIKDLDAKLASRRSSFVDAFLIGVTVGCLLLGGLDWWLGAEARTVMRERIGSAATGLRDLAPSTLFERVVKPVGWVIAQLFGENPWNWRFILRSTIFSTVLVLTAITLGWILGLRISALTFRGLIPPNVVAGWVSLAITVRLFRWLDRTPRTPAILLFFVLSAVTAGILMLYVSSLEFYLQERDWGAFGSVVLHPWIGRILLETMFTGDPPAVAWMWRMVFLSAVLPSLAACIAAGAFLGVKVLRPVLQPVVVRGLGLIARSEKGVLTQVSIAAGALAKAIQELLK